MKLLEVKKLDESLLDKELDSALAIIKESLKKKLSHLDASDIPLIKKEYGDSFIMVLLSLYLDNAMKNVSRAVNKFRKSSIFYKIW